MTITSQHLLLFLDYIEDYNNIVLLTFIFLTNGGMFTLTIFNAIWMSRILSLSLWNKSSTRNMVRRKCWPVVIVNVNLCTNTRHVQNIYKALISVQNNVQV
jgi:hypothetical protein